MAVTFNMESDDYLFDDAVRRLCKEHGKSLVKKMKDHFGAIDEIGKFLKSPTFSTITDKTLQVLITNNHRSMLLCSLRMLHLPLTKQESGVGGDMTALYNNDNDATDILKTIRTSGHGAHVECYDPPRYWIRRAIDGMVNEGSIDATSDLAHYKVAIPGTSKQTDVGICWTTLGARPVVGILKAKSVDEAVLKLEELWLGPFRFVLLTFRALKDAATNYRGITNPALARKKMVGFFDAEMISRVMNRA